MTMIGGKFLTFTIGSEEYGIPIQNVKEINGIVGITHVPKTPDYIKGVINLRGKIIPIMDLRLKFNFSELEYNERTCTIVVEIDMGETKRMMGIIVDSVSEVINISEAEMEPPPEYSNSKIDLAFLSGMGKVKGKVVLLLNINKILDANELKVLSEVS